MNASHLIIGVGEPIHAADPPTPEIGDLVTLAQTLGAPGTDDFDLLVECALRAKISIEHHPPPPTLGAGIRPRIGASNCHKLRHR